MAEGVQIGIDTRFKPRHSDSKHLTPSHPASPVLVLVTSGNMVHVRHWSSSDTPACHVTRYTVIT